MGSAERLPDVIAPGLRLLYCGINPSLYSAAVGHHFARPGNRFWKVLHGAGLTPRLLSPEEDRRLLEWGQGITNLVARPTAAATELDDAELVSGARLLARKLRRYRPEALVFVGIGAYRTATGRRRAVVGLQPEPFTEIPTWALPNTSGRTAGYSLARMVSLYRELRAA